MGTRTSHALVRFGRVWQLDSNAVIDITESTHQGVFDMAEIPTNKTFDNLTGRRFSMLTIETYVGQASGCAIWVARCDCGTVREVKRKHLLSGKQQSCGCWRKQNHPMTTHGLYKTPEYKTWTAMKGRCLCETNRRYSYYGGRGITICNEWVESFENFLKDMGKRPSSSHSIDRIDPNGNYEPSNCRWADKLTQLRNKRSVRDLTLDGVTRPIPEWCEIFKISNVLVYQRIKNLGWDAERALKVRPEDYKLRGTAS